MVDLGEGKNALWAGNANGDGGVIFQGAGSDPNTIFFQHPIKYIECIFCYQLCIKWLLPKRFRFER